jgi:hypothetical protein
MVNFVIKQFKKSKKYYYLNVQVEVTKMLNITPLLMTKFVHTKYRHLYKQSALYKQPT